jgi:hypothetical protein
MAPSGNTSLHAATHIATYGLGGVFLWTNRRVPGAPLIAAGAAANIVAIAANAGTMPASANPQRLAGLTTGNGFQNSAQLARPHLLWLGDILAVPGPWPLGNVLSIGDCIIYLGMPCCYTEPVGRTGAIVASGCGREREGQAAALACGRRRSRVKERVRDGDERDVVIPARGGRPPK